MAEQIDLIDFTDACMQAARLNDINAFYLIAVAQIESGIRNIPAVGSSGFGPFQILVGTWHEYKDRLNFSDDDRLDPFAQPFVAAAIAADGVKALQVALQRRPTPYELYFSHFFGVHGSKIILDGNASGARSIRDALIDVNKSKPDREERADRIISGNKSLLSSNGTPRSVTGVLAEVTRRMDEAFAKALPKNLLPQLDPDLMRELVVSHKDGNDEYWVVNMIGPEEGGQSIIKRIGMGAPQVVFSDTTVFPVQPSAQIPQPVADELNRAAPEVRPSIPGPGGSLPAAGANINAEIFAATKAFVGHDTSTVPGTERGNLACAWAVNEVVRRAFGRPIQPRGGAKNGLATAEMFRVLKEHHTKLNGASQAQPGTIIISPTPPGGPHGHVGIVGDSPGGLDETRIFSNSSGIAKFAQNFTIKAWKNRYGPKGLEILFFDLKRGGL